MGNLLTRILLHPVETGCLTKSSRASSSECALRQSPRTPIRKNCRPFFSTAKRPRSSNWYRQMKESPDICSRQVASWWELPDDNDGSWQEVFGSWMVWEQRRASFSASLRLGAGAGWGQPNFQPARLGRLRKPVCPTFRRPRLRAECRPTTPELELFSRVIQFFHIFSVGRPRVPASFSSLRFVKKGERCAKQVVHPSVNRSVHQTSSAGRRRIKRFEATHCSFWAQRGRVLGWNDPTFSSLARPKKVFGVVPAHTRARKVSTMQLFAISIP